MLDVAKRLLIPSKRSDVPPFIVMDVMAAAAQREAEGAHIIHMEVGQPAAPAPATARQAAAAALAVGRLGYTEALGMPSLRARIARHYGETYGFDLDPARVVVTTGSSGGFILAFLAMFEPGDRVALANPGYPPYRHILTALGCEPVLIETDPETRWALSPERLIAAHRQKPLKGVMVASPANPTGTMMDAASLKALIDTAEAEGIRVISDEIYHGLDYAFRAETAVKLSPSTVVINSFSKYFCMTGWRIGWLVAPEPLVRPIERLQQNLAISVPTIAQIAAEAAFDGREEMEAVKHGYEENRRILTEGLPKAGLDKFLPVDGAFYLYANIARFSDDSLDFAKRMLNEAGVAATPGIDFDPIDGRHYLRFCYAGSAQEMHEAVRRIGSWLKR
ncbi:aminotransferase class I/II-fold pyridoxal phosphate-dependent enzyme [Pseudolabrys taiwanensis]|uniref:aspartate transaminase n=1 Tax=Pseudolabrys taiwanensis TaxID=331696 RepID=A0A345ZU35_9HYPH|nr:aminotransferase class I/II-fold pyridoxal phosphate-dependent enzyme [Pseudolabrys taiwanensis]AXK80432.1 aminotransferase class I/II-fold pyridoxal phosphate-dependent enzyme [Pseudolabrys taiwanensis]